ncbi:GspE/PulE family protein [Sphingosinicella sp. BN140058]|uniref:GspE/PulE family protein n=1 Tax=Sphingosinicella sp. BN140058 TaxID=1892855 RepID=UPI001013B1AA|nr:ATPase, T2SS/T4P/T4SS family [Sphingosinicella sp. BN140058]QAY80148.1 type II/IV secretion system protein [Sphingosinicella sp. BN140058]
MFSFIRRGGGRKGSLSIHEGALARQQLLSRALGDRPKPPSESAGAADVPSFLVEKNLLEVGAARSAIMESRARNVPVSQVLGETGAVPREKIVAAIENTDTGRLAQTLDFDVSLPKKVIRELKIVVHAQTDTKLMLSSLSSISLVRQALAPYDDREIHEVPFSYQRWEEFEQGIERISEPGEGKVDLGTDLYADSIIPKGTEDAEVLDILLDRAAANGASDIHIHPEKAVYEVYLRIHGKRMLVHKWKLDQYHRVCAMVKDRASVDPLETRVPQDGSFSTVVRGRPFDVRVATIPTAGKEQIIMRVLDPRRAQMPLTALGITRVDEWRMINEHRNGLVLIVGATGSGKTTTLNATVREMPRMEKAVYTIEDPVEYRIPGVTHVQLNDQVGLDYPRAIRAFMRGDPDVIIVGEIRDPMTAAKAIQAAETGHLVLATIHAEGVAMAMQRLKGLGVPIEDCEMLLRGVLVQYLVRTICPTCDGARCVECFGEGYAGRTVISEIARVRRPSDVALMMSSDEADWYWEPLWKDIELKLLNKVTDGAEIYRTFSTGMEPWAEKSEVLRAVWTEERAKRHIVADKLAVASMETLSGEEKERQRRIALARIARGPVDDDDDDDLSGEEAEIGAASWSAE